MEMHPPQPKIQKGEIASRVSQLRHHIVSELQIDITARLYARPFGVGEESSLWRVNLRAFISIKGGSPDFLCGSAIGGVRRTALEKCTSAYCNKNSLADGHRLSKNITDGAPRLSGRSPLWRGLNRGSSITPHHYCHALGKWRPFCQKE